MRKRNTCRNARLRKMPMFLAMALGGLYRYRCHHKDDSGRSFIYGVTIPKTIQGFWYCQSCDDKTKKVESTFIWKSSLAAA